MSLNLTENEKQAIEELASSIRKEFPLARLLVFGSRAVGRGDEESDTDLLIVLPCPVTLNLRHSIVEKVFYLNLAHCCNISVLIVSEKDWREGNLSVLPIHDFIEEEGIPF